MNLEQYLPLALRTEKFLPTPIARLRHAALGLITETGEIATEVKRVAIYEKTLDDLNKDGVTIRDHIGEEIGDTFWYVAIACSALEMPFPAYSLTGAFGVDELDDMALALAAVVGQIAGCVLTDDFEAVGTILPALVDTLVPISMVIGIPLETILANNIDKLRGRFPDAYSNEAAEARADKGGLDARNS